MVQQPDLLGLAIGRQSSAHGNSRCVMRTRTVEAHLKTLRMLLLACVVIPLLPARPLSAQIEPATYVFGIEYEGSVCGYAELTVSNEQKDGVPYILLKHEALMMRAALGSEFRTAVDLTYHIDPKTGQFTYHDSHIDLGDVKMGSTAVVLGDKVVLTTLEHHSNLMPWQVLHHRHNVDLAFLETDEQGSFDMEKAAEVIDDQTAVVSLTHGSNVLGTFGPVKEIAKLAHDVGALVCVDAAQTVGHMPVDVDELGVDIMSFSGHKGPLGPTGIGALYVRGEHLDKLNPVALGGGTVKDVETGGFTLLGPPDRFEAGTPNIGGAIGLGAAVEYVTRIGTKNIEQRERALLTTMLKGLIDIDKLIVYGPKEPKLKTGVVSFNVKDINPHDVAIILDEMDAIAVRSGHHCAIPLVKRLGAPDGTVRVSLGCYNNEEDVDTFLSRISDVARGLG